MSGKNTTNQRTLGRGICIITGASKGFGRALAHEVFHLLEPGSILLLVARSGTLLQELKEEMQSFTDKQQLVVHCIATDLRTKEGVNETVKVARQETVNEIDHVFLINNAGSLGDISGFESLTDLEKVNSYLSLNVSSPLALTAGILQVFPCRSGLRWSVVNISSVFALRALPSWALYCTAKAARKMMFSVLAEEEPNVKVSYSPARHQFTSISGPSAATMENVAVFDSPGKGRGLKATKEFWAGDVIFSEPSLAAVVFDSLAERICHSCFRRQDKLQRCGQCKFAHYCDRTCQRAGWAEHKQECSAIKAFGKVPNENIRLVARIMWRLDKEGSVVSDMQLTTLEELEDHITDMQEDDLKEFKVDIHNFLDYWPRNSKQHTIDVISHIFGVINCNGFTVSDQRGLQAVGVGLFPNLCLVNHDCWPNCTVILNHGNQSAVNTMFHSQRRIELRSLGKIAEGEELTVAYVDYLNLSEERRRLLKTQYFFDCTCEHCKNGTKDDLKLGGREVEGVKPSEEQVKEATDYCFEMLEKMDKARLNADYHEVVKICRECIEKTEPILADTHIYLLRMWSTLSEVQAYLQYFDDAAEYARKMVEGYMKLYHPNNAALGMAAMRAGVTHWQAGQIEIAHGMICKAYAILMVTHGPTHPITKDLDSMRIQTEMELRMFKQNEYVYHSMREAALKNKPMTMMHEPKSVEEGIKNLFHRRK
ncbi:histone-lysine N-methyltransferase SMYD1-like isoform X1 [Lates japonicus]|uniref:[histone H3]-lysine(4) N-trimethyltransferase n=1 Tax=Lates japonicus TaxID=270547 RepID=A0AAD3R1U3_LATJO|nr:histone-lysine N-methyltransferase SMYD1-like isoform X1 [Lates japonicus]